MSPSPKSKATPATIGAALATLGSGIVALVNIKNISVVLVFATIFFLGVIVLVLLLAAIGSRN